MNLNVSRSDSTGQTGAGSDDAPSGDNSTHFAPADRAVQGRGEGIDRRVEKRLFTPKRVVLGLVALLTVGALGYAVWTSATGGQALNVDRDRITTATVEQGPFREFIAISGTVIPEQTVFLDAVEGGRIEEIFAREGKEIESGEPILRLSNNDLRLRMLNSEASLAEQQNRMEQLKMQMQQQSLNLQQQLAQMEHEIQRLERQFQRKRELYQDDLIAEEEYLQTRDELAYQRRRLRLTKAAYEQDSLAQQSRLAQMGETSRRLERSYGAMQEAIDNLTVRAPIAGQLTALDAEIGQIISSGTRLGRVDRAGSFKLQAEIDEYYIERVVQGQTATTEPIGDETYSLTVDRVYPEVQDGRFRVDLAFEGEAPSSLRRGQSVRLRLQLGQTEEALLLSQGGFYQSTGGNWAYVLTDDGDDAVRRPIRLGRQNPEHFEVLEGLEAGDRVVVSSYETFGEADRLMLE